LINGLKFCHEAGITHRDLKPENIFLDSNYILKIADFGFAASIKGRDGRGYLST
jgi:serine/threonine protein kinase